jgi:hypothetical protein
MNEGVHMLERIKNKSSYRSIAFFAGFLLLSSALSLSLQSPTSALSLNLGETVQAVTNNVPVVKNVVPLLTQPSVPQTTTQQKPVTNTPQAQQQVPVQNTAKTTPTNVPQQTQPSQAAVAPADKVVNQLAENDASLPVAASNGLSVGTKETQIASAIPHVNSPAISYGTKAIDQKTASAIVVLSLVAIAGGSYILYAYRPGLFERR